MEPAIGRDTFIFGVRLIKKVNLGDVMVFEHDNLYMAKRVAALPGNKIVVNGEIVTVPDDCFFMLGDNAEISVDSRYWDDPFVPKMKIIAKVLNMPVFPQLIPSWK